MVSMYSLAMVKNPNDVMSENITLIQVLSGNRVLVVAQSRIEPKLNITDPKTLYIILLYIGIIFKCGLIYR